MILQKISHFVAYYFWFIASIPFFIIASKSMRKRTVEQKQAKRKYEDVVAKNLHEPLTLHPEIDNKKCAGCGACVKACPEGDILKLINHKAVLIEPSKCVGHGECQASCPMDAIDLVFGTKTRGMDLPKVNTNYETNVPGLYIAGELGGMGLIRNAVKQGKLAVEHAVKNLSSAKTDFDVVIVGAGPAGLSASLQCAASGKRYICLEQNKFGGTIYNFPRQKIVMSHPVDFPVFGKIQFPQHKVSKEDILGIWHKIRKQAKLRIQEETKFETLTKDGGKFIVKTSKGTLTAQKVILAMGVRGTPRKLGLPNEETTKVTYNLLDPEQYQKKWIAVVGGGNAAVEAAQYLCKPQYNNRVFLLVRSDTFDRCNEENQNLILSYQKQGRVKILFNTSVAEIHQKHLVIDTKGKKSNIQNDFLFIFAGALLPFDFLKSLGIMIDKKFGEALKASV
ncbi:MAG: NAD(P)-binding domain-containing protein [Oligoflexales bacterium]